MILHTIWTMVWQTATRTAIAAIVGAGMSAFVVKRIRTAWASHMHVQRQIADRLDTHTAGGLTDVVEAVKR